MKRSLRVAALLEGGQVGSKQEDAAPGKCMLEGGGSGILDMIKELKKYINDDKVNKARKEKECN